MVFRMDKYGIILEVFIRTLSMQVLFGHNMVPMGQIKGEELGTHFKDLLSYEIRV